MLAANAAIDKPASVSRRNLISAALILQGMKRSPVSYTVWLYFDSFDSIRPEISVLDFSSKRSIIPCIFNNLKLNIEMKPY